MVNLMAMSGLERSLTEEKLQQIVVIDKQIRELGNLYKRTQVGTN